MVVRPTPTVNLPAFPGTQGGPDLGCGPRHGGLRARRHVDDVRGCLARTCRAMRDFLALPLVSAERHLYTKYRNA